MFGFDLAQADPAQHVTLMSQNLVELELSFFLVIATPVVGFFVCFKKR